MKERKLVNLMKQLQTREDVIEPFKNIKPNGMSKAGQGHLVVLEELEYGEYDVVDVAEAVGVAPARVVHAAGPVDSDVVVAPAERARRGQRPAGVGQALP